MNREDVIRMARETGVEWLMHNQFYKDHLQHFAALVAAHVRETEFKPDWNKYQQGLADGAAAERTAILQISRDQWFKTQADFEEAIRARGQA